MAPDFSLFNGLRRGKSTKAKKAPPPVVIDAKPPKAEDAGRPSIVKLGNDVSLLILQAVQESDPASLANVRLVSSNFNHLAQYLSCTTLKLDFSDKSSDKTTTRLDQLEKQNLLTAVRTVEAIDPGSFENFYTRGDKSKTKDRAEENHALAKFRELLPLMTGLKDVWWPNESLNVETLEILQKMQKVRLHLSAGRWQTQDRRHLLEHLPGNPNLYELNVQYTYVSAEDCLSVIKPVKEILLHCPNLRILTLDLGLPKSGCVVHPVPREYCGFGFANGERPPPLEKLVIKEYPFGWESNSTSYSVGYPEKGREDDYWVETFDWSQLKSLHVQTPREALRFMPKLSALREVSIKHAWEPEQAAQFYLEVPAMLEKISAPSLKTITLEGILRHGNALQELTLHQKESYGGQWAAEAIDQASLSRIRDECPHITDLTLDIARSSDWPWETLNIIASFPKLHRLTIWFELGVAEEKRDNLPQPPVTFSACQQLYAYLIYHGASHLQSLRVHSGAPPGIGLGFPAPQAFWPEHNSMEFLVKRAVRDDEAAMGKCTCECPRLSKKANRYLKGEVKKWKNNQPAWNDEDEAVSVAKHGPKAVGEWDAHY